MRCELLRVFLFKQKPAYERRMSDWSSDVCSSDLATLSPSAYSTVADRFPPRRLGIAIAIYAIGVSLGGGLATMFGGVLVNWATDHSVTVPLVGAVGGWRLAIFVVGLLGLPLALLMALTMREAPRRITTPAPPFADLGRYLLRRPAAMIGTLSAFSFEIG